MNSEEEIVEAVDQYIESISFPLKSLQQHHVVIMELVTALFRFSVNNDIAAEGVGGDIGILYGKLLELEPDALRKWLTDISLCFSENLVTARSRSTQSFVSKAKEHVRSQYADVQLSLAQICERLGVSNSYFSTVFKKETGKSFVSYVTDYRMEQAARLLIETNEKSYVIAQKVGYTDPNYFSYVFKRKFGVSPSKYRAEHIKSEKQVFESKCGYDMQGENQNTEKSRITERVRSWEKYGGWTNLKPKGIQTTLMGVFSLVSITIMLISGFVMYIWFSTLSREETVQSTQKLMEQTGESLEDYLVSMRQVSDTVYYNIIKESDFSKQKQEIQSRMNLLYEANKDNLRSIAIYNHYGSLLAAEPVASQKEDPDVTQQDWYIQALDEVENMHFFHTSYSKFV